MIKELPHPILAPGYKLPLREPISILLYQTTLISFRKKSTPRLVMVFYQEHHKHHPLWQVCLLLSCQPDYLQMMLSSVYMRQLTPLRVQASYGSMAESMPERPL